jgi:hypothetical protein
MKENPELSLEVALKVKQWAMTENHILCKILREKPELSDELQVFLAEVADFCANKYKASCQIIGLLAERTDLFGSDGLEKKCHYEEQDNE